MPDPQLIAAMDEIKPILQKYDCAALIYLSSPRHMEYLRAFSPSWSVCKLEPSAGGEVCVRIRALAKDYPSKAAQKQAVEDTLGIFLGFLDLMRIDGQILEQLAVSVIRQVGDVEHFTRKDDPP